MAATDISYGKRRANGALMGLGVCLFFGAMWIVFAVQSWAASPSWAQPAAFAIAAALLLALFLRAGHIQKLVLVDARPVRPYTNLLFGIVVVLEFAAILVWVNYLVARHLGAYQVFAVAAVVGLHFLPLAWLFRVRIYYWAGIACGVNLDFSL